ncbi:hypothetical protein ACFX2J_007650 [Malus domestica]
MWKWNKITWETISLSYKGLAIELFPGTFKELPFDLPYEFLPFNGTMNELAEQIYLKIKIHSKIIYFSNN